MVPPPPSDPSALRLAWVLMPLFFLLSSLAHLAYQVVKVKPHDKDAKMKYQECNKIVKQKAFERAIAGDEHKRSVVDSLDIESMSESAQVPCCAWPRAFPVLARALRGRACWAPLVPVPLRCLCSWRPRRLAWGLEVSGAGKLPCCIHPAVASPVMGLICPQVLWALRGVCHTFHG